MGERRWRASREAGLSTIPAIVRDTGDDVMLRDALLENLHRSQLNPLEEAAAYGQLLEDFSCTHEELAQRIGRSRPQISNTLRLLKLSPAVQRRVAAGVLSAGHARALLGVEEPSSRTAWRSAWWPRASACAASRRSSRSARWAVARPAARYAARPVAPGLTELADRLSERLETRVKVDLGKSRGKVSVEFATLDDLRRIVDIIDPQAGSPTDRPARVGASRWISLWITVPGGGRLHQDRRGYVDKAIKWPSRWGAGDACVSRVGRVVPAGMSTARRAVVHA